MSSNGEPTQPSFPERTHLGIFFSLDAGLAPPVDDALEPAVGVAPVGPSNVLGGGNGAA